MGNKNLNKAKKAKKDNFYTSLSDIENELKHYSSHFKNKKILCNCDDPRISNFFRYFSYNFDRLKLKKLTATCYKSTILECFSESISEKAVYLEYTGDKNGNRIPDPEEIGVIPLKGDGDFRSDECIELLKQADIVVTNPPFSLFKEYLAQLLKYNKKFIIIGNMNAVTYLDIFPLIKENKMWPGHSFNTTMEFQLPKEYKKWSRIDENGVKYGNVSGICWYTNIPHKKLFDDFIFTKKYKGNEKNYPKYDNYDAIEVGFTKLIPEDYYGVMGVPISFLDKYNPEQFEIVGQMVTTTLTEYNFGFPIVDGKGKYARILIKHRRSLNEN